MTKKTNWGAIKTAYEGKEITNVALAKTYGISESTIRKRAKKECWIKFESEDTKSKNKLGTIDENGYFFINDDAKTLFESIKTKLKDQLTPIDEPLLVVLSNQSARYTILEQKVLVEGETILSTKGVPYLNPTFNTLQSTIKTLATLSKEFGLTIASRKRAGVNISSKKKEDGLFTLISKVMSESNSVIG